MIEEDLLRNYAEEVPLLTGKDRFHGHEGLRRLNAMLFRELPGAQFEYRTLLVEGEVGFLEWSARTEDARIADGADSYVARGGQIVAQILHYRITDLQSERDGDRR